MHGECAEPPCANRTCIVFVLLICLLSFFRVLVACACCVRPTQKFSPFAQPGEKLRIELPMADNGQTAGYAFIEFRTKQQAIEAKLFGDGHVFDKRWVRLATSSSFASPHAHL
jgi:hypothetical protein